MTNKIRTLISLLLATGLMVFGAAANADSFTVELNVEFSGATAPEGSTPWLEMTVDDSSGNVVISIEASNLTDDEYVSGFYLNYNPALDPTSLGGTITCADCDGINVLNSGALGADAFSADGGGYFDFFLDIQTTAGAGRWTDGETLILTVLFPAGAVAGDFDFLSVPPGGNCCWTAAAHIQSIGDDNQDSGWIGGRTDEGEVPEPGTLALFGLGLTLMGVATRRRRITPKS